jgi:prefoldin subunit 5
VSSEPRAELQRLARIVERSRQRLEELDRRKQSVLEVVEDHRRTGAVLTSLIESAEAGTASGHVGIGAGVSLPLAPSDAEGRSIVDLGSGVYGERTWSGALEVTLQRQKDLQSIVDELEGRMSELEEEIAQNAVAFNTMAERIEADTKAEVPSPSPDEDAQEQPEPTPPRPAPRRRRFGSELTLDD